MIIEDFILRVKNLDAKKLIIEAASLNLPELADLNTNQLSQGLLSDGNRTDTYSSPIYAEYKKSIGSKSSPYADLKLTGAFYEGFYTKIETDKIKIGSTDDKESELQRQFGSNIFGVNEDDFIDQIDPFIPELIDKQLIK